MDDIIDSKDYYLNWIIAWVDKYILKVKSPLAMKYYGYSYMYDVMKNDYKVNPEAQEVLIDHMNRLVEIYSKVKVMPIGIKDIIIEEGDNDGCK